MEEAQLLRVLYQMNEWWNDDNVPPSLKKADHRRRDFYTFRKQLAGDRQISAILGPRQVGKTTLCGQLIDDMLHSPIYRTPPEQIMYLTIDNSQILSNPENIIRDSINVFERHILGDSIRETEDTIYVFIDEIQKAEGWADTLKYFTDTYSNLEFVIAGSVSTLIQQDASETLVGRITRQLLFPLKFNDYINYHGDLDNDTIYAHSTGLRDALAHSVKAGEKNDFVTELIEFYASHEGVESRIISRKDEYLIKGGYPGILDANYSEAYDHLDTDLRYTVTGDLANVFNVNKAEKVLRVLSLLAYSTGSKINIGNIADTAGINRETVERYIEYLKEFFLISPCERYYTSEYHAGGRDKMYLQDVGIYNTLNGTLSESSLTNGETMGSVLETAVMDHARRLQFYLSDHQNADVYYWDAQGEVDCIVRGQNYTLPIEIKFGDSTNRNLRGLRNFLDQSDADYGLVVNDGNQFTEEEDVLHIPAWLFFFLC